jgi:hypothetical protein
MSIKTQWYVYFNLYVFFYLFFVSMHAYPKGDVGLCVGAVDAITNLGYQTER